MERSNWWYILPVLGGIIGGIIGYFAIRGDDEDGAKYLLLLGGLVTVLDLILILTYDIWIVIISVMV